MKRWLLGSFSVVVLLFVAHGIPVEAAPRPDPQVVDEISTRDHSFCWLWGFRTPFKSTGSGPSIATTSRLVPDYVPRGPGTTSSLIKALHTVPGLASEALRYQVPLWRFESPPGASIATGQGLCPPDPIVDFRLSPQPVIQGHTVVLHLRTRRPVECEVIYLGETVPCYHVNDRSHYALVGISALTPPGEYPLDVSLSTGDRSLSINADIDLASGHYGYQFIDPPAVLKGILSSELMESEWAYLKPWRDLRTKERTWTYPFQPPLEPVPSISADYGDRRSYGGMFEGYHSGIDYRAASGTVVVAPAAGRVVLTEHFTARGNAMLVDHGWGVVTGYWHLSGFNVQVGDRIAKGDILGWVGNTGLSTGSHLHWEVWVNGVAVDGRQWLDERLLPLNLSMPIRSGSSVGWSDSIELDDR